MNYKKGLFGAIIVVVLIVSVFVILKIISRHKHDHHAHDGHGHAHDDRGHHDDHCHAHDDHAHDGHELIVHLSEFNIERFGIEIGIAEPGELEVHVDLPGVVAINTDRVVHIVPRVSGIVREVKKNLGDTVAKGEVLAVIESSELANDKAAYLTAIKRLELAQANYSREEKLRELSAEQDYLNARQALVECRIELRSSKQKLISLGFSKDYLEKLYQETDPLLTSFDIIAPFEGEVIKKHIALGQVISADTEVFVIADLSTVWVDLRVHQKDLARIKKGQEVRISTKLGMSETKGSIDHVAPIIDAQTRTALARVVLNNASGQFRPGSFVTASVLTKKLKAEIVVAKSVLQNLNDETVVFVQDEDGFKPRTVTLGLSDDNYVEILSGLEPGEEIVIKNAFRLKAQLEKDAGGGPACHSGHH